MEEEKEEEQEAMEGRGENSKLIQLDPQIFNVFKLQVSVDYFCLKTRLWMHVGISCCNQY